MSANLSASPVQPSTGRSLLHDLMRSSMRREEDQRVENRQVRANQRPLDPRLVEEMAMGMGRQREDLQHLQQLAAHRPQEALRRIAQLPNGLKADAARAIQGDPKAAAAIRASDPAGVSAAFSSSPSGGAVEPDSGSGSGQGGGGLGGGGPSGGGPSGGGLSGGGLSGGGLGGGGSPASGGGASSGAPPREAGAQSEGTPSLSHWGQPVQIGQQKQDRTLRRRGDHDPFMEQVAQKKVGREPSGQPYTQYIMKNGDVIGTDRPAGWG